MRPEVFGAILEAAYPGLAWEQKRTKVMLGLSFVSMGCVLRRFLGLPHVDAGAVLLAEVKRFLPNA